MKPLVISVVGPTAVGKSKLGVEIAKRFEGEVISGDSMQIYKSMDIGTAKVTEQEMQGIPHHLVDIKEPDESFSVAEFQNKVQSLIRTIGSRGKVPVIVGGTGLYIQATLYNFNFSEEKRDEQVIKRLEKEASEYGIEALYQRLQSVDPEQAEKVHPNNERRVLRALEVFETTGKVMSDYQKQQSNESPFRPVIIGLEMEREELYNRINRRVDQMVEQGLIAEVKRLYDKGYEHTQAMKAIGYKEFLPYFNGEYSLDRAVELLKRNSRRYAKRQYTYFRNKMNVRWYSISEQGYEEKFETILNDLAGMMK
ncbi:tRNA (adenosine(37)-N6)-dimethylallyltransferase MiaA [Halobacillus halophilus]|uniref:tRNA dimethylallyltransferase n=1 Tax=Halobacillus halophilus (strain ATCC 35676 / DSM 2266 / JCM 20832 / KCTC 3685 / LMG 17431 / NBRC 102448 / NCIMB 2269) TaxID=866895 RepID=I0JMU9_HALH3|nr:tRNA (adenosine(37)-N6)-dimethylallyltransferase MiaA [Halobacillus halophilus]ASF39546.1 tRNA (adenosine(37)-N6)-dimethylallyltransferase MiaA [Halobacillus halophilus]CCG45469.1 tRNA dimethylallyltransferase [Halobacillus halophilus DSM 2266]